jgi:hypothetical protein
LVQYHLQAGAAGEDAQEGVDVQRVGEEAVVVEVGVAARAGAAGAAGENAQEVVDVSGVEEAVVEVTSQAEPRRAGDGVGGCRRLVTMTS